MKSKNEKVQFLRLYLIDEEIRRGTFPTAKQLAKKLEVSERTVLRDMDFLRDRLFAPLEYDAENGGWHYTEKTFFLKYTSITQNQMFFCNY